MRAKRFDEVCDDVSIKVQSRTLNNIVGFVKVTTLWGLSILIPAFSCGGLLAGVHLNPLPCSRPNGDRRRGEQRQGEKERVKWRVREQSSPLWSFYVRHYSSVLLH